MEISNKVLNQSLFILILYISLYAIPQISYAGSAPIRHHQVMERLEVTETDNAVYARIFFRHRVLKIWSYPSTASNIVFVYVRPIGSVPSKIRNSNNEMVNNPIFTVNERLSVRQDTSHILDRIRYEGNIDLEGGILVIDLTGDYFVSVQQGKKFESIALIIRKDSDTDQIIQQQPPVELKDLELIEAE